MKEAKFGDFKIPYTPPHEPSRPHKCPVCSGTGLLPPGFYNVVNYYSTGTSIAPETCRTCTGFGVLWSSP